ncbi:glycosyltransferase family 2 protein [Singulisphaera acidiphila]|uniref:Putative glycosyltransferase n=1 Tax=Singulisphaera acidiphila (strain ATCC BAA-1392 / DSM 18658 / VKM B-2454 / MOB10) TaxID=886293 RepID=L0DJV3_SINAD|nr:glycosyltransferase family 2 protein [Singulisphaera acidiphila]AGA29537.1 putative glycosyltransferase [Singulisphaera acidiphila DSM 18658]
MNRSLLNNPESLLERTPLLTVVIVNYDSWPEVHRLVGSLEATPEVAHGICEVIVVDNASPSRPPAELLQAIEQGVGTQLLARADNGGFSAGVNAGWQAARSSWLLVLNPDVLIPDGELSSIVARIAQFEADPTQAPGIVGFKLLNPDGTRQPSVGIFPSLVRTAWEQLIPRSRRKYQPGWRTRPGPVAWVTGACMLLNRRMLAMLGGMDEDFFLYYEEVDLCRSAQNRGWSVIYDQDVQVVHLHPLQNRAISPRMRVITRHSKLLYFRKHLPRWQFLTLSRIISLEAIVRRTGSMVQGRTDDGRAWRTIGEMARAFRKGLEPRGRQVLTLADSVIAKSLVVTRGSLEGSHTTPQIVPAGKRRGPSTATLLKPRKDGPACR